MSNSSPRPPKPPNTKKLLKKALLHSVCIALMVVMFYPVLWLLSSSFKDNSEIFSQARSLIPGKLRLSNYVEGWRGVGGYTFATFMRNSVTISLLATLGAILSSAVVGYGFARIKFRGSRVLFGCMLVTMMLPYQIVMIPQYVFFHKLKWVNTVIPLVLPHFTGSPFFIFMVMQFIRTIPRELDNSAVIDGCSQYGVFLRIIVPLLKPALLTVTIFSFYWTWEDFLQPLIYLSEPRRYTVAVALRMFADPTSVTNWGAMFAMSVASLIPVAAVFFVFQSRITEGISLTGLKA